MSKKTGTVHYDMLLFGKRVAQLRQKAKLTQEQLAEHMELSVASVSHIENGKTICDLNQLVVMAAAFNVTVMDLLDGVAQTGESARLYYDRELTAEFAELSIPEKKLVHGFIKLLKKELHKRGPFQ